MLSGWFELPQLLAWEPADAFLDTLQEFRSARADQELGRVLGLLAATRPHDVDAVLRALGMLDGTQLRRVLDAPRTQTCFATCPPAHLAGYLAEAVAAELARDGRRERATPTTGDGCTRCTLVEPSNHAPRPRIWTCTGDRAFGTHPAEDVLSPPIGAGLFLDVAGPAVTGWLADIPGEALRLTANEAADLAERGRAAVAGTGVVAPPALSLLTRVTRTVVCRRDPTGPGSCAASSSLAIGQTVLRNPQSSAVDPAWLAEGLVHEAIHAVIDVLQLTGPMLLDPEAVALRLPSPWTGRSLDADTYLQACWVWYGIVNLWSRARDEGAAFPGAVVDERWQRAARGFLAGDVRAGLAPIEPVVEPAVLAALAVAQERIRATASAR